MSEKANPWEELRSTCRYLYVCWLGRQMCHATRSGCDERRCPALGDDGSVQDASVFREAEAAG